MNRTQLSRLFWVIKISLVVMIVYVAANAIVAPLRLGETFKPREASGRESTGAPDNTTPQQQTALDYSVVAKSGLFGNSEQTTPAPAAPTSAPSPRASVADDDLGLKLVGTLAGQPDVSRAIIEDCRTKATDSYRTGETVASATIESIARDKVVLRHHGQTKILMLNTDTTMPKAQSSDANGVRSPSVIAAAPTTAHAASPPSGRLGQVEALFREATIEPYLEKGQAEGLRLTGLENIPIAAAFGLKNGDVVQSVNGQVLTSKQKAFQVLQKARAQSKVNMQLLRDGRVTDLSFNAQ
jgi:type II secretion system protein C